MNYRKLGKTGLMVSEIGFGPEWMTGTPEETRAIAEVLREAGVNYLDCWMPDPHIRANLGYAMKGHTDEWIVQGHIGACWVDGQYLRSRDVALAKPAFEDELALLGVDHFEVGMMHYIDSVDEFRACLDGPYYEYVQELLRAGTIRHVGLSTHNPEVALEAARREVVEVIMFSINPAFDLMPASEDVNDLFGDFEEAGEQMEPLRAELYSLCEEKEIALTVMKPYAGGRLLMDEQSPFGKALTPVQCIHYCLTRPAVASVFAGYQSVEDAQAAHAYLTATEHERDISHSSAERIIAPDTTILIDYMLNRFGNIVKNLTVFPENMKRNMNSTFGLIFSQRAMLTLIEKGMTREQAYDLVQPKTAQSWDNQVDFKPLLEADPEVTSRLTQEEIDEIFNPTYYTKRVDEIFKRVGLD